MVVQERPNLRVRRLGIQQRDRVRVSMLGVEGHRRTLGHGAAIIVFVGTVLFVIDASAATPIGPPLVEGQGEGAVGREPDRSDEVPIRTAGVAVLHDRV